MSIWDTFKSLSANSAGQTKSKIEFIIVGLGNIGMQYENTRHNAGFMVIDTLAEKYNVTINRLRFKSNCAEVTINNKGCLLMKPSTYMNNSGEAVVEAMNFYKIPINNVIVLYDDISLDPAKLRIRRKGSDGGHNGIKSIIQLTGEDTFPRIKIGVGKKPHPDYNLADWVLSKFRENEMPLIKESCQNSCTCIELMLDDKISEAMNKYNN